MPYLIFLCLLLFACGSTDTDQSSVTAPNETSAPAPGVSPTPPATGDVDYQAMTMADFAEVGGCSVLLTLDNGSEGYVLGFGYPPDVAEGHFGGAAAAVRLCGGATGGRPDPLRPRQR